MKLFCKNCESDNITTTIHGKGVDLFTAYCNECDYVSTYEALSAETVEAAYMHYQRNFESFCMMFSYSNIPSAKKGYPIPEDDDYSEWSIQEWAGFLYAYSEECAELEYV